MERITTLAKIIFGLALGGGLCAALILRLDVQPADAQRLFAGLSWFPVAGIFVLTFLLAWSGARKWQAWSQALYCTGAGTEIPSPQPSYFRAMVFQSWVGQFVPPSLAIILGRGMVDRAHASFRSGVMSGTLDQAREFLFLLALLPAGFAVLWFKQSASLFFLFSFLGTVFTAAFIFLVAYHVRRGWCAFLPALMAWSILRVALTVARLVLGAPALGVHVDLLLIASAAPVVALLALIPLTPGNLGIAEWGWVGVLSFAGTPALEAALLALGFRVLVLVAQTLLLLGSEVDVLRCRKRSCAVEPVRGFDL